MGRGTLISFATSHRNRPPDQRLPADQTKLADLVEDLIVSFGKQTKHRP
jgi:hypothetical protein